MSETRVDPHERACWHRRSAVRLLDVLGGDLADDMLVWKATVEALLAVEARLEEVADNVAGVGNTIDNR